MNFNKNRYSKLLCLFFICLRLCFLYYFFFKCGDEFDNVIKCNSL